MNLTRTTSTIRSGMQALAQQSQLSAPRAQLLGTTHISVDSLTPENRYQNPHPTEPRQCHHDMTAQLASHSTPNSLPASAISSTTPKCPEALPTYISQGNRTQLCGHTTHIVWSPICTPVGFNHSTHPATLPQTHPDPPTPSSHHRPQPHPERLSNSQPQQHPVPPRLPVPPF